MQAVIAADTTGAAAAGAGAAAVAEAAAAAAETAVAAVSGTEAVLFGSLMMMPGARSAESWGPPIGDAETAVAAVASFAAGGEVSDGRIATRG